MTQAQNLNQALCSQDRSFHTSGSKDPSNEYCLNLEVKVVKTEDNYILHMLMGGS